MSKEVIELALNTDHVFARIHKHFLLRFQAAGLCALEPIFVGILACHLEEVQDKSHHRVIWIAYQRRRPPESLGCRRDLTRD